MRISFHSTLRLYDENYLMSTNKILWFTIKNDMCPIVEPVHWLMEKLEFHFHLRGISINIFYGNRVYFLQ